MVEFEEREIEEVIGLVVSEVKVSMYRIAFCL